MVTFYVDRAAVVLRTEGAEAPLLMERRRAWTLPADFTRIAGWTLRLWQRERASPPEGEGLHYEQPDFRKRLTAIFEQRAEETDRRVPELLTCFVYSLGGLR
ncbi:MAG: hypothetical protein ACP5U2_00490 [Bryobacteraceae bacterium]